MVSRSDDDKESDKELVKASQEAVSLEFSRDCNLSYHRLAMYHDQRSKVETKPWPLGCRLMHLTSPQKSHEELARASAKKKLSPLETTYLIFKSGFG